MKPPLTPDSEFIVGEEKALDLVMCILFLALGVYGIIDTARNGFTTGSILVAALFASFHYFTKSKSKRVYIRVNTKGIFQDEVLVTSWPNFIDAYIDQGVADSNSGNFVSRSTSLIRDDFILVVEYAKGDSDKGFRRKIPLTNTQNKSEEDVLAAVKYFWEQFQK